jgi:copper chaperone CopZ
MKKHFVLIAGLLFVFALSATAQEHNQEEGHKKDQEQEATLQKETFTVYGNCGMCERTIENSLKDVEGVINADWDKDTDIMSVSFTPGVITLDAIKQKIADVGYDSDSHRAKDEVYNSLPGCCQYDRPKQ